MFAGFPCMATNVFDSQMWHTVAGGNLLARSRFEAAHLEAEALLRLLGL